MVAHELSVGVHPEVRDVFANQEHWVTGRYSDGLPEKVSTFAPRIDAWAGLVRDHYAISDHIDLALDWRSEDARTTFIDEASSLGADLQAALGRRWSVRVSSEPGVSVVRVMGEYSSAWPLWNWEGGTDPEDWPMLSIELRHRLSAWALEAEPGHGRDPDAEETERLAGDVRRELGPRFVVKVWRGSRSQ